MIRGSVKIDPYPTLTWHVDFYPATIVCIAPTTLSKDICVAGRLSDLSLRSGVVTKRAKNNYFDF